MKRLTTLFLIIALLAAAMGALAEQPSAEMAARSVVPENAELVRTEKDDGLLEYLFVTPDNMRYQVDVNPNTLTVQKLEMEAVEKRAGASVVLTQEDAEKALLALQPGAVIHFVRAEREDGGQVYQIRFSTEEAIGQAELNAETGALREMELTYTTTPRAQGNLTADEAKELALSMVQNGRIVDFETDRDDGRVQYEGELIADGVKYDFTIDAATGSILEWEIDINFFDRPYVLVKQFVYVHTSHPFLELPFKCLFQNALPHGFGLLQSGINGLLDTITGRKPRLYECNTFFLFITINKWDS
jgi:uncharacterized membrane protein YkoI